jgi:hypothetical protein
MNIQDIQKGLLADTEFLNQFKSELAKGAEVKTTYTFDPSVRSIFSPENLEADVKLLVPTDTPLRNRLPRTRGFGEASAWKRLTSRLNMGSDGYNMGTNTTVVFADAGAPNETSQTYSVVSAPYKLLGRKIEVGVLANTASRGGITPETDMFAHRQRIKMLEVMLGEEELIIGGDSTKGSGLEFDGLGKQITTNSGTASLLTASGIGVYCETLYRNGASPTMLIASARQTRALADELQGTGSIQRIMVDNQGNGIGGVRLAKIVNPIDGTLIDIMPSRYVGGNAFLLTERSAAGEVWIDMQDLIPMSRVDVPSSNLSMISFVYEATVLRVIGEPYQYKIAGLAI